MLPTLQQYVQLTPEQQQQVQLQLLSHTQIQTQTQAHAQTQAHVTIPLASTAATVRQPIPIRTQRTETHTCANNNNNSGNINDATATAIATETLTSTSTATSYGAAAPHAFIRYTPQTMPDSTWSLFPPIPHITPVSTTSFSLVTTHHTHASNTNTRDPSSTLAILQQTIHKHMKQQYASLDTTTQETNTTDTKVQTTTTTTNNMTMNIDTRDIKRVYMTKSKRDKQQYILYVHCVSTHAYQRVRQHITDHTTLTVMNAYERYIVGRVHIIPHDMTTDDLKQFIRHHAPQITTLSITRSQQARPSTHYRQHAFFAIRADEIQYLSLIPALPHTSHPLIWEKYIPPLVPMCSFCFSKTHKRHACPHLQEQQRTHTRSVICANCTLSGHVARQCRQPVQCRCCDSQVHNVLECAAYKPTYQRLNIPLPASSFPALSRSTSALSVTSSVPFAPSPTLSDASFHNGISTSFHAAKKRHRASISTDDIRAYEERSNHSPLSPNLQHHLDTSSLTRSDSVSSSIASRSPTPSPRASAKLAEMQAENAQDKQTIAQLHQQLAAMMQQMQQMKQHMQQQMTTTTTATATNDQQIHDTTSTQANTSATTETPSATMHD